MSWNQISDMMWGNFVFSSIALIYKSSFWTQKNGYLALQNTQKRMQETELQE